MKFKLFFVGLLCAGFVFGSQQEQPLRKLPKATVRYIQDSFKTGTFNPATVAFKQEQYGHVDAQLMVNLLAKQDLSQKKILEIMSYTYSIAQTQSIGNWQQSFYNYCAINKILDEAGLTIIENKILFAASVKSVKAAKFEEKPLQLADKPGAGLGIPPLDMTAGKPPLAPVREIKKLPVFVSRCPADVLRPIPMNQKVTATNSNKIKDEDRFEEFSAVFAKTFARENR